MIKNVWFIIFLMLSLPVLAQQPSGISASEKEEIIEKVVQLLNKNYVFPDKAKEMEEYLRKQNKSKAYKGIHTYQDFAEALTRDLHKTHKDLHLAMHYSPTLVEMVRKEEAAPEPIPEMEQERLRKAQRENFGFVKVEHLPGNIGYVDFREFYPVSEESRQAVAVAMGFIANTDAVILDLRYNSGGYNDMVSLMMSYFFDEKPLHYISQYHRPKDITQKFYTLSDIEGRRMTNVDLYVLTSGSTFSAAEALTYSLQTQKRATVVGETTGGAAHPTDMFVVNDYLVLGVPVARAISPVTKTNWEGTGIIPDVPSEAGKALLKARQLAMEKLIITTSNPDEKAELEWELLAVAAEIHPIQLGKEIQAKYAGKYGERNIILQENELYYQRSNSPKRKMIPIAEDVFRVQDIDYFRIKVIKDESGNVTKLLGLYQDGRVDESARTN